MLKDLLLILNPCAGKGQAKARLFDVVDRFVKAGYRTEVYTTQQPGDARALVAACGGDYDRIVCCGGDGTLNEVVSGLMTLDERPPVGYIPAGTTNDLAAGIGIPKKLPEAADTAAGGTPFACDVGQFGERYFTYVAAFGTFTEASYGAPQPAKNMFGRLAYIFEGMKHLPCAVKPYHVRVTGDDAAFEDDVVFGAVTNSTSVGGFRNFYGGRVRLDDGRFEALFIKQPKNAGELQAIVTALNKRQRDERWMYSFRTAALHLEADQPIPWTLDGEFGGEHTAADIVNHCRAVNLLVNKPPRAAKARADNQTTKEA